MTKQTRGGIPPPKTKNRLITREEAERFLPRQYADRMDSYFPKGGVTCGEEHLQYVLGVAYPILREYRDVVVGQSGPSMYTLLGDFAIGDRDLDHSGPGHVHFVGLPGTGKSLLGKVPEKVVGASFKRIQGTIDLLPADIIGTNILQVNEKRERYFKFIHGPIFSEKLLFDEISRVSARSLSSVLQVMSEGAVTAYGVTHPNNPHIIATSNPDESAGVQKMPDALEDRFMFEVHAEPFTEEQFAELQVRAEAFDKRKFEPVADYSYVIKARLFFGESVHVSDEITDFIGALAVALNRIDHGGLLARLRLRLQFSDDESIVRSDRMILSGRGILHLRGAARSLAAMRYRNYVTLDDVRKVLREVIRHRTHCTSHALNAHDMVRGELIEKFGRSGKTAMEGYLLREIIDIPCNSLEISGR